MHKYDTAGEFPVRFDEAGTRVLSLSVNILRTRHCVVPLAPPYTVTEKNSLFKTRIARLSYQICIRISIREDVDDKLLTQGFVICGNSTDEKRLLPRIGGGFSSRLNRTPIEVFVIIRTLNSYSRNREMFTMNR